MEARKILAFIKWHFTSETENPKQRVPLHTKHFLQETCWQNPTGSWRGLINPLPNYWRYLITPTPNYIYLITHNHYYKHNEQLA